MYTDENQPFYTVYAYAEKARKEKTVATTAYKQDALKIAQRFLNASVVRTSPIHGEQEVYAHGYAVPKELSHVFTHEGLKQAKAAA